MATIRRASLGDDALSRFHTASVGVCDKVWPSKISRPKQDNTQRTNGCVV